MNSFQPGDVLLFARSGFWGWLIRVKTFSDVSHVEMVAANPEKAWAARDGIGVDEFEHQLEGLKYIYRPTVPFSVEAAATAMMGFRGQKYDWWGLLRFFTVGRQSMGKQFCSELVARLLRAGNRVLMPADYDADLVSPGMFKANPLLGRVWEVGKGWIDADV